VIPFNAIQDDISFEKLLNKIPKSFRSIAEIILDMVAPSMRKKYSFKIIARIDIPWAIDITEEVSININGNINNISTNINKENSDFFSEK
jgi:hypothetical protein